MSAEDDVRRPLDGILEGLADSVADEDPAELVSEAQAAGQNPETIVKKMKEAVSSAIKKFEQKKLQAAREAYRLHAAPGPKIRIKIASTPEERRRQLSEIGRDKPEIAAALTAQYRDFESLSDEDVESTLEDLAELGFLDDSDQAPDET
jgi:crotonobetainyl-CoA:carnitine CoA-transferase CaiB-like acyl-CoA transferase